MLVIQVFVLRDGAFIGNEVFAGDAVDVGGRGPRALRLDGIDEPAARIRLDRSRLVVERCAPHVKLHVNGAAVDGAAPRPVSARDDVGVGPFTLKLRVLAGLDDADAAPAATGAAAPDAITRVARAPQAQQQVPQQVTLPETHVDAPVSAVGSAVGSDADVATALAIADTAPDPDATLVEAAAPLAFRPLDLEIDVDDEELDDDDLPADLAWSLRQHLEDLAGGALSRGPLVEIVRLRGELVVDHCCLRAGDTLRRTIRHGKRQQERVLVRYETRGVVEIVGPVEGTRRTRDGVEAVRAASGSVRVVDGEHADLTLAGDDADGARERVLVRFAPAVALAWTREDAAEERMQRRVAVVAASASASLFALASGAAWLAQFRSPRDLTLEIHEVIDEPPVRILTMQPPPPPPQPEPQLPQPAKEPQPKAKQTAAKLAAGPKQQSPQPAASSPISFLDDVKGPPRLSFDDDALDHIKDPIERGGTKISGPVARPAQRGRRRRRRRAADAHAREEGRGRAHGT